MLRHLLVLILSLRRIRPWLLKWLRTTRSTWPWTSSIKIGNTTHTGATRHIRTIITARSIRGASSNILWQAKTNNRILRNKTILHRMTSFTWFTMPNFSENILLTWSICSGVPLTIKTFSCILVCCLRSISQCAPVCWLIWRIVSPPKQRIVISQEQFRFYEHRL